MARTRQLFIGGTLASLALPALLGASGTPALAHYIVVQQGRDMASVSADHRRGSVCDREKDGNAVYGNFFTGLRTVTEWDGGDRGCDNVKLQPHEVIKQVKVRTPGAATTRMRVALGSSRTRGAPTYRAHAERLGPAEPYGVCSGSVTAAHERASWIRGYAGALPPIPGARPWARALRCRVSSTRRPR